MFEGTRKRIRRTIRTAFSALLFASLTLNAVGFYGGYFQHALESTRLQVVDSGEKPDQYAEMRTFSGNIDRDIAAWESRQK